LGDVIAAARELLSGTQVAPRIRVGEGQVVDFAAATTKWYLRLEVADAPGVLARIAATFGDHRVSIMSLWQEGRGDDATLLLVTHDARESDLRAAAKSLDALDVVKQVAAAIRVISPEP
jgi:homoserine dehydrogenase